MTADREAFARSSGEISVDHGQIFVYDGAFDVFDFDEADLDVPYD